MTRKSILVFIFTLSNLLFVLPVCAQAEKDTADNPPEERVRGVQYNSREEAIAAMQKKNIPLLAGMSVSGDLAGLVMAAWTPYGQIEGAFRLNLKERFFPIVEAGWGISDHTSDETDLHYKTNAPYFRIGCDYNFSKEAESGNRIYAGIRYAFTSFKYDIDGPSLEDPFGGASMPFHFTNLSGSNQWAEMVFGLEAKIWGYFHLGWSVRYKFRMAQTKSNIGQPWYVPGFGKNDSSTWGGTFNLVFDL